MRDLIPIKETYIQQQEIKTVNARDLHAFLEVGKRFTTWIQDRIEQYGFVENMDFLPILGKSSGGRPSTEYHITIDMAKELSMVERNERGKQARQYFISKEREANDLMAKLNDPVFLREQLNNYSQKLIETQHERDEAIKTKAYISDKKTASAMGTASAASRRARAAESVAEKHTKADNIRKRFKFFQSKFTGKICECCGKKIRKKQTIIGIPPSIGGSSKWTCIIHANCLESFVHTKVYATDAFERALRQA